MRKRRGVHVGNAETIGGGNSSDVYMQIEQFKTSPGIRAVMAVGELISVTIMSRGGERGEGGDYVTTEY